MSANCTESCLPAWPASLWSSKQRILKKFDKSLDVCGSKSVTMISRGCKNIFSCTEFISCINTVAYREGSRGHPLTPAISKGPNIYWESWYSLRVLLWACRACPVKSPAANLFRSNSQGRGGNINCICEKLEALTVNHLSVCLMAVKWLMWSNWCKAVLLFFY